MTWGCEIQYMYAVCTIKTTFTTDKLATFRDINKDILKTRQSLRVCSQAATILIIDNDWILMIVFTAARFIWRISKHALQCKMLTCLVSKVQRDIGLTEPNDSSPPWPWVWISRNKTCIYSNVSNSGFKGSLSPLRKSTSSTVYN